MSNQLVITKINNHIVSTLMENDELIQINAESEENEDLLGNIYIGKVKNIIKNINAVFIEIKPKVNCYLIQSKGVSPIYVNQKKNQNLCVGDEIIVQVAKDNIKTKLPSVKSDFSLTGKYIVLSRGNTKLAVSSKITDLTEKKRLLNILSPLKNENYGFVIRTNAMYVEEDLIQREINHYIALYENILQFGIHKVCYSLVYESPKGYLSDIRDGYSLKLERIITDLPDVYEVIKDYLNCYQPEDLTKLSLYQDPLLSLLKMYRLQTKIEKALHEKIWLKSGGSLVIQPTEALTVIDVNTGKAINGKKNIQQTFFKINLEAAKEIARQIRLRNLSGIILVDFIDMEESENKKELMLVFDEMLKKDPIKTILVDMTALGLVEITRKKVRKPLHEQFKGVIV